VTWTETRTPQLTTTFGRLVEVYVAFERELGRSLEERCGIPHSWFEMMLRISRSDDGRISMGELAGQVALTTGGVTRLFDRMVAAGFAERVPSPRDRRVVYAALSPAGRTKLEEATEVHEHNLARLFGTLSSGDRRQLDDLLERLRGSASRLLT